MELKGKLPNKIIRRGLFRTNHFDESCCFLSHETDKVTQRDKVNNSNDEINHSLEISNYFNWPNYAISNFVHRPKTTLENLTKIDDFHLTFVATFNETWIQNWTLGSKFFLWRGCIRCLKYFESSVSYSKLFTTQIMFQIYM